MIKSIIQFDPFTSKTPRILTTHLGRVNLVINKHSQTVIRDLHDTLDDLISKYGSKRGIGLAANQIGYDERIIALFLANKRYTLVNPTVKEASSTRRLFRIGCFSLYKYRGLVRYSESIAIDYLDEYGNKKTLSAKGDQSLIIQHELDHLDGKLIFDCLPNGKSDLFIPREQLFPNNRIWMKNYGVVFALKKKLGLPFRQQTTLQYYSALFRDTVDWKEYVDAHVRKRSELMTLLDRTLPKKARILEAGCGSSALSVYLSTKGHDVKCIDIDKDMLDMAKRCNKEYGGKAKYDLQDLFKLTFVNNSFDIVYSHGVLEELGTEERIVAAINEALRVGSSFIFSVPTIWDRSNNLLGEENLWTVGKWRKIISKSDGKISEKIGCYPFHPRLGSLNRRHNNSLRNTAPVILFKIDRA